MKTDEFYAYQFIEDLYSIKNLFKDRFLNNINEYNPKIDDEITAYVLFSYFAIITNGPEDVRIEIWKNMIMVLDYREFLLEFIYNRIDSYYQIINSNNTEVEMKEQFGDLFCSFVNIENVTINSAIGNIPFVINKRRGQASDSLIQSLINNIK